MMFFASLKMMLLVSLAMMRCLPLCARRHTSLGVSVIIGRSPHHLPKANIIQKTHPCHKTKVRFLLAGVAGFGPTNEGLWLLHSSVQIRPPQPTKNAPLSTKTKVRFLNDVCLRQMMLAVPMMTATPNDVCLRAHKGKHRIIATRSGATSYLRSKCIISPQAYIINRRLYRFRNDDIQHFVLVICCPWQRDIFASLFNFIIHNNLSFSSIFSLDILYHTIANKSRRKYF